MLHTSRIMSSQQLLLLIVLLTVVSLVSIDARWTVRPRRTTTIMPMRSTTAAGNRHQHLHHWPPLVAPPQAPPQQQHVSPSTVVPDATDEIRLIDSFDQRSPDGQHEYRFQLSNGDTRYERTYWLPVGKRLVLARTGYYSVPLPGAQYSTVFYRADHRGYHVDTHTLSGEQPLLPRSLDVPQYVAAMKSTPAAKRNSISVPKRNDSDSDSEQKQKQEPELELHPDAQAVGATTEKSASIKVKVQPNVTGSQKQTELSTVATLDDIFAAKLGNVATATAPADDNDDDVDDVHDVHDVDDDDV